MIEEFNENPKTIIKEMKNAVIHIRIPYKWKEICKRNANQMGFKTMSQYCVHLIKLDEYYQHSAWPRGKGALDGGAVLTEEEWTRKLAYDRAFELAFRRGDDDPPQMRDWKILDDE